MIFGIGQGFSQLILAVGISGRNMDIRRNQNPTGTRLIYFSASLLFAGCDRGSAPAYDSRRSEAILDACEALAKNDDSDAEKALSRLNDFSGADDFATSANLALQRKMNFAKADKYLQQSD